MDRLSERRLVENEVVFKKLNQRLQKAIKAILDQVHTNEMELLFYCECSNLDCKERIKIPVEVYEKIHKRNDHFALKPGHEIGQMERIVSQTDDYLVVQKLLKPITA
jgi:hypothetical protein